MSYSNIAHRNALFSLDNSKIAAEASAGGKYSTQKRSGTRLSFRNRFKSGDDLKEELASSDNVQISVGSARRQIQE